MRKQRWIRVGVAGGSVDAAGEVCSMVFQARTTATQTSPMRREIKVSKVRVTPDCHVRSGSAKRAALSLEKQTSSEILISLRLGLITAADLMPPAARRGGAPGCLIATADHLP